MAEAQQPQPEPRQTAPNGGEAETEDLDALKAQIKELTQKQGRLLNENKKLKGDFDKAKPYLELEEAGQITADQLHTLLTKAQEAELSQAKDRGEIEKIIAQVKKQSAKEIEAVQAELAKSRDRLERVLLDDRLRAGIVNIDVLKPLREAAFALHRRKMKLVDDEDSPYGQSAVVEIEPGKTMDVDAYLKNWAETDEDAGAFLNPSRASGAGAMPGGAGGTRLRFKKQSEMSDSEKSQFIRNHPGGPQAGVEAYFKLPR